MIVVSWANLGGLALSLFISGGFCPRTPHGVEVGLPNAGRLSAHQIKEDKSEPLWAPCCCLDRWGGSEPAPMCHISSCNFMESARLPPPPRAKNKYRRLKRFKFVSAIWIPSSLNHGDQFVISWEDQRECTHINTYENPRLYTVPFPCFKIPCQLPLDLNCCYTFGLYCKHKYIFIISGTSSLPTDKFKDA